MLLRFDRICGRLSVKATVQCLSWPLVIERLIERNPKGSFAYAAADADGLQHATSYPFILREVDCKSA